MGAISLTFYKGSVIKYSPAHSLQLHLSNKLFLFSSSHENWILGALLLAAASFTLSIWNIIQVETLKAYPEAMTIISFYSLFGTISSAVLSLVLERNPSAWSLKPNMDLLVIVLTDLLTGWSLRHLKCHTRFVHFLFQMTCIRMHQGFLQLNCVMLKVDVILEILMMCLTKGG